MTAETVVHGPNPFRRWIKATTLGWLLGFVLVVILAMLWDLLGGGAQFMVGIGMGAGVGFMQARVLDNSMGIGRRWMLVTTLGMGIPFLLWDVATRTGLSIPVSLPLCVLTGSLLVGIPQSLLLRTRLLHTSRWIVASIIGWGLPVGLVALSDSGVLSGVGTILSLGAMFLGGVVLGAVTGKALEWMPSRPAL